MTIQTFKSQYGRKGIKVRPEVPTLALIAKLGRTHVGTPAEEVETMVREQIASRLALGAEGWTAELVEQTVRFALWRHEENRAEYAWVMGGGH